MVLRSTVLLLSLFLISCSNKVPKAQVSFHTQTPPGEAESMVFKYPMKGKALTMRRMPDFVTSNFSSYRPFPAKKGRGYGAMFILDDVSAKRLIHYSTEKQGLYMVGMMNGRVGEAMVIDRPIRDGVLVIWEGMTQTDLHTLDVVIPRTGEKKEESKERSKLAKKALKAAMDS